MGPAGRLRPVECCSADDTGSLQRLSQLDPLAIRRWSPRRCGPNQLVPLSERFFGVGGIVWFGWSTQASS